MAVEDTDTTQGEQMTVEQMLAQIQADQRAHRQEVASLREELAASREPAPATTVVLETAEQRRDARLAEAGQYEYYCPGCGRLYHYQTECVGTREGKHLPIPVVSTDEMRGDPSKHTAAPPSPVL